MNHSKLFTAISMLFATLKTKKKSIATSFAQSARRTILSILGLFLFSATAIQSSNPGTLDTNYNTGSSQEAGFVDLTNEITTNLGAGTVKSMLQMSDGSYFVLAEDDNSDNSYLIKFNSSDVQITIGFGTAGVVTISNMATANDMILMQDGNLLIVGVNSLDRFRIVSLNPSTGAVIGDLDIEWGGFYFNNAVAQQSNGRLIFSGAWSEEDTTLTPGLIAFNPLTFQLDPTFGEGGIYRYPALPITTPQGLGNMVIDTDDNIYFVIQYNDLNNLVGVYKLSNTVVGPVLWTGNQVIPSLGDSRYNQIARDQNGNIIVASSGDSSNKFINVYRFKSDDGSVLQTNSFAYATTGITYPLISGLFIDDTPSSAGNIILTGYDATNSTPFVMRILSDFTGVDTSFNASPATNPGVQPITVTAPASSGGSWGAGFISANGKITVGGYATISSTNKPYLMRLYGNDNVGEYSQAIDAGVPGTLNLGFGTDGYLDLSGIIESSVRVVLPIANGYQYIVFDDGTLVRLTNGNDYDFTYGPNADGRAVDAPLGVTSMIIDANGCLVLVGTDPTPHGWIVRYAAGDSGEYDLTFNNGMPLYFSSGTDITTIATCVVEQTMARLVVAGSITAMGTVGCLFAVTNTGEIDTTFYSNLGYYTGTYVNVDTTLIPSLVADQDDRLIFAYKGTTSAGSNIYLVRITASGEPETDPQLISDFGINVDETNIRVCLDVNGNIVVAGLAGTEPSTGIIAEFTPDLSALTTFGSNGYYTTAVPSPIAAMTVDDQGRIYIAYAVNTTTPYNGGILYIQRISADGITLDGSFGMGGTVSMLAPDAEFDLYQIKLQLDVDSGFLVVAGLETRGQFARVGCFNISDGSTLGQVDVNIQPNAQEDHLVPFNISDLFIDTDQRMYLVGYTTSNDNSGTDTYHTVVGRIYFSSENEISIDSENYAVDSDTPGIANFVAGPLYRSFKRVNGNSFMIGGAILDQDRRVYVIGQSGGDVESDPYMIRLFGNYYADEVSQAVPFTPAGGPGYFDDTYGTNGLATTYADNASSADAGQQARAILPFNTGTNSVTVIGDGSNDSSYGSGQGIMIAQNATGSELVQGMIFEGSGNEIVFGSNDIIGGYIKNILPSGEMNPIFGGYTGNSLTTNYPAGTMYIPDLDIVNSVVQLRNGHLLFAGNKNGVGMIGMMTPTGIVVPFGNNVSGFFSLGTNIASLSIDEQENIFASVAMADNSVSVIQLNRSGAYVSGYGTTGVVSDVLTGINDPANVRSAHDGDGNLLVAGSVDDTNGLINVVRLLSDGSIDPNFNSGSVLTITFDPGTSGIVTNLIPLQSGQTLVAGYQYYSYDQDDSDYEFVACITPDGILDATFGAYEPTPGLVKFQIASGPQTGRNIWGMSVQWNGQILLAGSEGPIAGGEIPLTMRLEGYANIKAIPQFPTLGQLDSNNLDLLFNGTGIGYSDAISNLIDGGYTLVDSQKRIILGGMTSDNIFVAARFLPNGERDLSFGNQGVASSTAIPNVSGGSFIAIIGSAEHILVGGVTSDNQFVMVKFSGANGDQVTSFGTDGLASSPTITNLIGGGYISIDFVGNILVGGRTSDNKLVVARFTSLGVIDTTFNFTGVATTSAISGLHNGGFVTAKGVNGSMYVGGVTTDTLVIAKIFFSGTLDPDYGTAGVASVTIPELVDGGSVALDGNNHIVIGGYTGNKVFVVAKFLPAGTLDPLFNGGGIAYSNSLSSLTSVGDIFITSNNFILIGGTSVGYDNVSTSMVVASFSDAGVIETTLSPTGLGFTGIIPRLIAGGFVAANVYDNPFVGGFTDASELVVAKLLSGYEIFITNPSGLSPQQFKMFWYGNNPALFRDFFAIEFYARVITDEAARIATIAGIKSLFDQYVEIYAGQPGWNLVNSTYRYNNQFAELEAALVLAHLNSADQIHEFFRNFNGRRIALQIL